MTSRLMRHAIREPTESDLAEMSVRTILSQSHLAPFPQRISPIFWGWDLALESVKMKTITVTIFNLDLELNFYKSKWHLVSVCFHYLTFSWPIATKDIILHCLGHFVSIRRLSAGIPPKCLWRHFYFRNGNFNLYYPKEGLSTTLKLISESLFPTSIYFTANKYFRNNIYWRLFYFKFSSDFEDAQLFLL